MISLWWKWISPGWLWAKRYLLARPDFPPRELWYAGLFGFNWLLRLSIAAFSAALLGFLAFDLWSLRKSRVERPFVMVILLVFNLGSVTNERKILRTKKRKSPAQTLSQWKPL